MSDRAAARAVPRRAVPPRGTSPRVSTPRTGPQRATPRRPELSVVEKPAAAKAAPAARPARRTRNRPATRRAPFVLLVVGLLVVTTIGLLVLNTAIAVDSLKATQLQAENAERAQEAQRLEQQVVTGASPAEIASAAVAAGLVPAGPAAYLVIAPDGTVTLRGTPQPATDPAAEPDDED
jgi:hypothetical protein